MGGGARPSHELSSHLETTVQFGYIGSYGRGIRPMKQKKKEMTASQLYMSIRYTRPTGHSEPSNVLYIDISIVLQFL